MSNVKRYLEIVTDINENLKALAKNLEELSSVMTDEPASADKQTDTKPITLEQVRAVLADKSQAGYTAEVRELIAKYGSNKLSGIDPKHYSAIIKEAEEIGNA